MNHILKFLGRWQEFLIWMPLLVALCLVGYVVLGAFDRSASGDALALLLELVVRCAYLACVGGAAWLFKRTYLRDISAAEEAELHAAVHAGDTAARWLLIKDRLEWLFLLVLAASFLWVAR